MERLIEVNGLKKYFPIKGGFFNRTVTYLKAVDDISFYINSGEVLGIVGESGCGKSTTGRAILRLHEPDAGEVMFEGEDLCKLDNEALRKKRRNMQLIYQDPYSSLNPRRTVGDIVGEPILIHENMKLSERRERVKELLQLVGLSPFHIRRYPHEFSGGQRQRIGIARALACNPKFIVCDEAVSALDVSIQAQMINLFEELKENLGLTYMFISHDLSVVKHISNRIGVMYLGKLVEMTETDELFCNPLHPYTKALLSAVPVPNPRHKINRIMLYGDVPSAINTPPGCVFAARCSYCMEICKKAAPEFKSRGKEHFAACHLLDK
jgi:oligopeptide/dipeptide ABC transporter ATP-binding protein